VGHFQKISNLTSKTHSIGTRVPSDTHRGVGGRHSQSHNDMIYHIIHSVDIVSTPINGVIYRPYAVYMRL